jgi:hypothetical protein
MRGIEARLAALEQRLIKEPLVLHYEDGTTEQLCVRDVVRLFACACRDRHEGKCYSPEVEAIRRAACVDEPGGSRICEMIKLMGTHGEDSELDASE